MSKRGKHGIKNFNNLPRETQLEIMSLVEQGAKKHKIAAEYNCYYNTIPTINFWEQSESSRRLLEDNILIENMGWV